MAGVWRDPKSDPPPVYVTVLCRGCSYDASYDDGYMLGQATPDGRWITGKAQNELYEVTHWAEMPDPPAAKEGA
jgi:hypothetical protein